MRGAGEAGGAPQASQKHSEPEASRAPAGERGTRATLRCRQPRGERSPAESPQAELGDFAAKVLDVVEAIPPGRVMSYGDIAEYLGEGGPRQVGRVMALWGGGVAWWRVIHNDGSLLDGHERAALARYREERTPMRPGAHGAPGRVDMRRARWNGRT